MHVNLLSLRTASTDCYPDGFFKLLSNSVRLSTHADRQGVDISFTVCFFACIFVILCVCTVSDFSGEDNANGVKFCTVVQDCPGQGISHFGELCFLRSPKSDEAART